MIDITAVEKYKLALVDEYYSYLDIIKYVNNGIDDLANDMEISIDKSVKFDYPDFCKSFIRLLREYSEYGNNIQDESVLYSIFEQMMYERILEKTENIEKF